MKVEIKGKDIVITMPANTTAPAASKSGKTLIVASSQGNQKTGVLVKGKELVVGVNAYIAAE